MPVGLVTIMQTLRQITIRMEANPAAIYGWVFLYNPEVVELIDNSLTRLTGESFNQARKSLVAEFLFNQQNITVINNHFSSKGGSSPIFGQVQPFINAREDVRAAQAGVVITYESVNGTGCRGENNRIGRLQ